MAESTPIVVGGGIQSGSPFALNHLVYVTNVNPPQLESLAAQYVKDGSVFALSVADSTGTYPSVSGATETLRVQGGIIVSGSGTDTVQIGRAASATANLSTVIGTQATDGGQVGVVIGYTASFSACAGVCIGNGASCTGNAGGSTAVVIGTSASANVLAAGTAVVIGDQAVGRTSDVVIGYQASSSASNAFGASNVVIGTQASANIAQGTCVVVGTASHANVTLAVVIGGGSSVAITKGIVVGEGSSISSGGAGSIVIGQGSSVTAAANVILGNGVASGTPNICWLGGPSTKLIYIIFGEGDTVVSPAGRLWRFTNGSGTDNAAGDFTLVAPISTGAGTPARIIFQVGHVAASSATLQTATTVLTIGDGIVTVASGAAFQLGSAYAAGAVTATGTIPIKDNTGTTYNVLVHT